MSLALAQALTIPATDPDSLLLAVRDERSREAFLELFRLFAPKIKGWLRRGGLPELRAEELTQDVMIRVWRRAPSWKSDRGNAQTWIFAIARNARIDHFRKKRLPTWDEGDPTLVADPDGSPLREARRSQVAIHIREALQALPEEQADVIRSAYFEHMSMREIAQSMDIPVGTVKSRVRLAMSRLRMALGSSYGGEA